MIAGIHSVTPFTEQNSEQCKTSFFLLEVNENECSEDKNRYNYVLHIFYILFRLSSGKLC